MARPIPAERRWSAYAMAANSRMRIRRKCLCCAPMAIPRMKIRTLQIRARPDTWFSAAFCDTHKNWWECDSGIAYLVSGVPGWRAKRMTQIYDLSDPAKPVFIRDFGLPGQQPGSTGPVPSDLHGPISTGPKGNRVYFGYGSSKNGIVQIVDRQKLLTGPKEPTDANLIYPQISRLDLPPEVGAHSAVPLIGVKIPIWQR